MYRSRTGTSRAKQLKELEQEKDFRAATRFMEKNIGKCHEMAVR